jgi:predicted O-linked N-acetylglucosamine transferase (SPINDLY family)
MADTGISRSAAGLPESGFVFCCFNNTYKITPTFFDLWADILRQVPDSVLWLIEPPPEAVANLRREMAARDVSPQRLVFAKRLGGPQHLERHTLADLFLDTLPYNAHTTASDALWAGVPLLTVQGQGFAGRVAASLLQAVGLHELVTDTHQDYVALAVSLAREPARLSAIKEKLSRNRHTHPLFDTTRYTRNLERAIEQAYQVHLEGKPATHMEL